MVLCCWHVRERIARIIPSRIGGPGTKLPRIVESVLSWAFAINCLSVALWHYQVDRCLAMALLLWRPNKQPIKEESGKDVSSFRRHTKCCCLPLTTHSFREWSTVSKSYQGLRTRYHELLRLIYASILSTTVTQTKPPRLLCEEKKDDKEQELVLDNNHNHNHNEYDYNTMGESVAKWLSSGLVVSTKSLQIPSSKATPNNKNIACNGDEIVGLQYCRDSYETLIGFIRTNEIARRLASLIMGKNPVHAAPASSNNKEKWLNRLASDESGADTLLTVLREIWPRLLELPASFPDNDDFCSSNNNDNKTATTPFAISVIVPAFREDPRQLATKLWASLKNATEPQKIELIIVHVVEEERNDDDCRRASETTNTQNSSSRDNDDDNDDSSTTKSKLLFANTLRERLALLFANANNNNGSKSAAAANTVSPTSSAALTVLEYFGGGGRGPCLNYGANHARGEILAFLHADTRLSTNGWDKALTRALSRDVGGEITSTRTTCCAFAFAIDTSPEALRTTTQQRPSDCEEDCKHNNNNTTTSNESSRYYHYYPPGLRAIEVTANLRCRLFSLPYGDQCLSLPADVFRYVGGYPDQCLMEDYELIRLLRMRTAATYSAAAANKQQDEKIQLLSDHKAVCSPRRWQNYGVLYVTYTNSYCVKRYNNGEVTPDQLFCEYYGTKTPPHRISGDKSPWEAGLYSPQQE